MGKSIVSLIVVLLCHFGIASAVPTLGVANPECVTNAYLHEVGVREATGNNDGVRVGQYLHTVGLGEGYSWCSAFVKWCYLQCGIETPITAWSPSANNPHNLVFTHGRFIKQPLPGDVFTLYSNSQHRIHHTGFFHAPVNDTWYETVEGNTNNNGSANGDGVYRRRRTYKSTYTISRWLQNTEA